MTKLRECGDKDQLTKREALDRVWYKRKQEFVTLNSYKCKYCGWYHIGHPRRRRR